VSAGSAQLAISALSVVSGAGDIVGDNVELTTLVVDHVSDISEQLIEFADGLFDVANFGLALDDQGLLEVDIGLIS
jgi:hypothetical protein